MTARWIERDARLVWTYRLATALVVVWMLSSGVMAFARATPIMTAIAKLGYPPYFVWLLGISKLAEASALVMPVHRELKSWAYAGSTFELLAAVFSYGAVGASAGETAAPLAFLALVQISLWSWRRCEEPGAGSGAAPVASRAPSS
jgi:hypothetical protein